MEISKHLCTLPVISPRQGRALSLFPINQWNTLWDCIRKDDYDWRIDEVYLLEMNRCVQTEWGKHWGLTKKFAYWNWKLSTVFILFSSIFLLLSFESLFSKLCEKMRFWNHLLCEHCPFHCCKLLCVQNHWPEIIKYFAFSFIGNKCSIIAFQKTQFQWFITT